MYLSGLHIGFTTDDLRTMPFPRLAFMLDEWNDLHEPRGGDSEEEHEATQADIKNMLM